MWDDTLATMASEWANACVYEHGQPDGFDDQLSFDQLGQNIAITTDASTDVYEYGMEAWYYSEKPFYDLETNSCEPGEVCGHYTQVQSVTQWHAERMRVIAVAMYTGYC